MQNNTKIKMATLLALSLTMNTYSAMEDASSDINLQDIVVTATKTETPAREIGYSVTVLDREEIERSNSTYVTDALKNVRGLDFWSSGPRSSNNTLSIRGLNGYHSKVLVNGIPVQDTSGPQILPTLNNLTLDNVERIEIIRGASSTLYGANAVGGVVNIITRKGEDGIHGSASSEFGSHGFQKYAIDVQGRREMVDFFLSANHIQEDGISVKSGDDEKDSFRNQNYSANIGYQLDEKLRLQVYGSFSDIDEEYDGYEAGDWHIQRYAGSAELSAKELFNILDSTLSLSTMESRRGDRISGDAFDGETREYSWRNTLYANDRNTTTIGYTYTTQDADLNGMGGALQASYYENALYAQHQIEAFKNLFLTGGLRHTDHSKFGGENTYSAATAYLIDKTDTKLLASMSTGYRAPSLFELFEPTYGNPNLDAENSETWDIGFEQSILDEKFEFGITYFDAQVDDFIGWSPSGYGQAEGITSKGLEGFVSYRPLESLSLRFTHTYMDTDNLQDNEPLLRRPRNKSTADITYIFLEELATANLQAQYVGSRDLMDFDTFPANRFSADGYTLANLALSCRISENMELYGRIHNLLDEDYEEVHGYNTYKRTYYAGLKFLF